MVLSCHAYALLLLFIHHTACVHAFGRPVTFHTNYRVDVGASSKSIKPNNLSSISTTPTLLYITTRDQDATASATDEQTNTHPSINISLEALASSGVHCKSELPHIFDTISSVCEEYGMSLNTNNIIQQQCCSEVPSTVDSIPGVLGRVLLIKVHGVPLDYDLDENELFSQLKIDLSERIDMVLSNSGEGGDEASNHKQTQPILLAFRIDDENNMNDTSTAISDAIEKEVLDYSLREGVDDVCQILDDDISVDSLLTIDNGCFTHPYQFEINCYPQMVIEIDGDMVQSSIHDDTTTHFDTSSILVFDKLLDKKLRKRLLNVVKGYPESHSEKDDDWNDIDNGPDPQRWIRGGLMDVVPDDNSPDNDDDNDEGGTCWGLSDEAITDICFGEHPAIDEFESKLSQLFPDFVVSRLPEAVLGECVSPLTANAPTHGDTFDYHIDADPYQVPPSPWADVFGRYPNRQKGKPRFVSCLVYLNDEWDAETFGAPTRFLDPKETIDILPKPGRVVIMDQDISHTVVAPNVEAGNRPRYSLVWKLILHPTEEKQDMDLSCGRKSLWPEPIVVGSANVNNDR